MGVLQRAGLSGPRGLMAHWRGVCCFCRMDSLVQCQARELSQLRQQIRESRELGALQRLQLEGLGRAFEELLQAGDADHHKGDVIREQLDKSLTVLEKLEERLENGALFPAAQLFAPLSVSW